VPRLVPAPAFDLSASMVTPARAGFLIHETTGRVTCVLPTDYIGVMTPAPVARGAA